MECEDVKYKYKELIYKLREAAALSEALATIMSFSEGNATAQLYNAAADAIDELNRYAEQMDKLREDGWYLLQETTGTYGPITMKMPIPDLLSCDDVLSTINGEPPKEET